jgi:UDP-GlcNAc:undecaprenyl-phosphate/decaprenyl-phosphate GlcNAc-1-phosphate transferase
MRSHLAIFIVSLLASVLLTPLARRVALSWGAVGNPGGRNVHSRGIPRLGGVALAIGWSLSVLAMLQIEGAFVQATLSHQGLQLIGIITGGLALCVIGAVDDVRGLRAAHKLAAQVVVAVLAYACGFRIDAISLPIAGTLSMGVFALPVTVIWIVGITNAMNLIDGLDGLAAGVAFFGALTSFVIAHVSGSPFVALLSAGLMGVLAGFLFFNFNPARIFMGDSGSYFLGYVLATLSLSGALQQKASTAVSLLVPMIALGLPIFDTFFTMLRRFLERRSIFSPDRGHIHHRLLDLGLTHRRAVIVLYGVCVVFTAAAIAVSLGRMWQTGLALLSASVVLVALVRFVGYFEYLHLVRRQKARIYDRRTNLLRLALPALLARLETARTEEDVLAVLSDALEQSEVERMEIDCATGQRRFDSSAPPSGSRDIVRAAFPVGREDRAQARVRFLFRSDEAEVRPEVSILLQLLVDGAALALERAGSRLGPLPADAARSEPVESQLAFPSSSGAQA